MSGDTSSTGEGTETTTPPAGDAVQTLQRQLTEQRDIQRGLDKKVLNVEAERDGLAQQLETAQGDSKVHLGRVTELESQATQATDQLSALQAVHDTTLAERDSLQATSLALEERANRLTIVADVAREHPAILSLAAEGALPTADTDEGFREALARIGESIDSSVQTAATATVAQALGGAKPNEGSTSRTDPPPENLWAAFLKATKDGDTEEAERLRGLWTVSTASL